MTYSSNKLIAITLSVMIMLLPMQSGIAYSGNSMSGSDHSHDMSMKTRLGANDMTPSVTHEMCEHCKTGDCDMLMDCFTGVCFTTTVAMQATTNYIDSARTQSYPLDNSEPVSVILASLYRPPRLNPL